jgi:hypothetical protein
MTAPRHLWSGDWRRESDAAARDLAERRPQHEQPAPAEPEPVAAVAAKPKPPVREAAAPKPKPKPRAAEHPPRRPAESPRRPPPRRPAPPPRARADSPRRAWSGSRTLLIVVAALVSAGVAYAAVSALVGSSSNSTPPAAASSPAARPTQAATRPAWLGVTTESVAGAGGGFSSGSGTGGGFTTAGVIVTNVVPGSPADAAGLEPGDVITQIDKQTVNSPDDVNHAVAGMHAGQQVVIQYQRGPFANTAAVTLATQPSGSP